MSEDSVTDAQYLSAASRRALQYTRGPEWFCQFKVEDLQGDLQYQEGVIRRDPSAVLLIDGTYYAWYTRGEGETIGFGSGDPSKKIFPWDLTEVWYATSTDGWHWHEQGLAVGRDPAITYGRGHELRRARDPLGSGRG
jgi:hypothetical protein